MQNLRGVLAVAEQAECGDFTRAVVFGAGVFEYDPPVCARHGAAAGGSW